MMAEGSAHDDGETREVLRSARPRRAVEAQRALAGFRTRVFGALPRAVTLSRYVLLDRIGEGGAGTVWSAFDPELDRRVAIKLVMGERDDEGETRLLREAKAIARLHHPNVVAIHDVGHVEGELAGPRGRAVFIVMELMPGGDVRRWLAERKRSNADVLAVFIAAGRGLAAAHAAGIVHRDFKPSNVLLGDGVVRVCDFGLARPVGEAVRGHACDEDTLVDAITRGGAVLGTPLYMAPEQHEGGTIDARSDQFAFCAALFEALAGAPPFSADTIDELRAAKRRGLGDATGMSPAIAAALRRGLAVDPADRFASMDELLARLAHDPRRTRRIALASVTGVAVIGAIAVSSATARSAREQDCLHAAAVIDDVWNDDSRAAIGEAFARAPYGETVGTTVAGAIDDWAARWRNDREEACRATVIDGVQPSAMMVARTVCYDDALDRLRGLVELLRTGTPDVIASAHEAVGVLPVLTSCTAPRIAELDAAELERRRGDEAELAHVEVLAAAGRVGDANEGVRALLADRDAPGIVRARASLLAGRIAMHIGDREAEQLLFDGFLAAERAHADEVAARALIELAALRAAVDVRLDDAARTVAHAEVVTQRGPMGEETLAELDRAIGIVAQAKGDGETAVAALRRGLARIEAVRGADHPRVAAHAGLLASVLSALGRHEEAAELARDVVARTAERLGRKHPVYATNLALLGLVESNLGDLDLAIAHQREALEVFDELDPSETPRRLQVLNNLAIALLLRGDDDEAETILRAVLERKQARESGDSPSIAATLANLGALAQERGRFDEALELHRRALAMRTAVLGAEHPDVGRSELGIASALLGLGDATGALPHAERGRDLLAAQRSEPPDDALEAWQILAEARAMAGHREGAAAAIEHAIALARAGRGRALQRGDALFAAARLLAADDPARAESLAAAAREAFAGDTPRASARRTAVDRWLADASR
jgi:tetratricopeptide (TPR) repeat protein